MHISCPSVLHPSAIRRQPPKIRDFSENPRDDRILLDEPCQ